MAVDSRHPVAGRKQTAVKMPQAVGTMIDRNDDESSDLYMGLQKWGSTLKTLKMFEQLESLRDNKDDHG